MSVNKFLVPILAITLFLGTVGIANASGYWIVSGKEMVDVENLKSGDDIRGWMSLQEVADGVGMDVADLKALLGIPAEITPDTALKDMEGLIPDFEVTTVRDAVNKYLGVAAAEEAEETSAPNEPATEPAPDATLTSTPAPAQPAATPTAPAATAAHVPQGDGSGEPGDAGDGTGPTPLPPGTALAAADIKGRHTLADIAEQAQVPLDELLVALGLPDDTDTATAVRDLVEAGTLDEIETVRSAVAKLQNP